MLTKWYDLSGEAPCGFDGLDLENFVMHMDASKPDGGAAAIAAIGLSLQQWFALPIRLRQRWWQETDYSKKPPSADLVRAMLAAATGGGAKGLDDQADR